MKNKQICIATAQIRGLNDSPYYFEHHCFYAWRIIFLKPSTIRIDNLPVIPVGETKEEGEKFCNQLKQNFREALIHEGEKVAVIFEDDGQVLAIGSLGSNLWIDTRDKFVKKTFKELNININSLKVY